MKIKTDFKWLVRIVLISVASSMTFTLASTEILGSAGFVMAFVALVVFILIGIIFDIIGLAVAVAPEAPFHSMAAHRVRGSAESLMLIKNADKTASFCGDVVGDVSGIVSGSTAGLVVARLVERYDDVNILIQLLIPGLVTGLMIGGKAVGKTFAINNSTDIVLKVGKLMSLLKLKKRGS